MVSINPVTGAVTNLGAAGAHPQGFGATFASSLGDFYGNANNGAGFFQFNLTSGAKTLVSGSPGASLNDGAHCAAASIQFGADLSITKDDGNTTFTPGGSNVVYSIVVANPGPFGVTNATVTDTLPPGSTGTWTCSGSGGGVCANPGGVGNINELVNLPVGGSVTFQLTLVIPSNFIGNLTNSASVAPPAGIIDPAPGNNTATDTDTANPMADLSITKTNGVTTVTPGGTTTYTITASNAGPSAANPASVIDSFPAACTSVSYTSVAAGGATGNTTTGAGNISDTALNLPSGGSVTYTAICTIGSGASGTLLNTANVASIVPDPAPGNNSATDSDTVNARPPGNTGPTTPSAIPTLDGIGLAALIVSLSAIAAFALRQRRRM